MLITLGNYRISCFLPPTRERGRVVYLHMTEGSAEAVIKAAGTQDFVLVVIKGVDWIRELSPWKHEKVFAKGEDFAGGADEYLTVLTNQLIPAAEEAFQLLPEKRYLVGYSLSGLFAVYAMYHTSLFDGIASISGSLWYDGFYRYVETHTVRRNPDKLYFSLGDKEAASARGIMQTVFVRTAQIVEKYQHDGINTVFCLNKGGHFAHVPERIGKGIGWLLNET